jgi:hypothetical protein
MAMVSAATGAVWIEVDRKDPCPARSIDVAAEHVADVDDGCRFGSSASQRGVEDSRLRLGRADECGVDHFGDGDTCAPGRLTDACIAEILGRVSVGVGDYEHPDTSPLERGNRAQRVRCRPAPENLARATAVGQTRESADPGREPLARDGERGAQGLQIRAWRCAQLLIAVKPPDRLVVRSEYRGSVDLDSDPSQGVGDQIVVREHDHTARVQKHGVARNPLRACHSTAARVPRVGIIISSFLLRMVRG